MAYNRRKHGTLTADGSTDEVIVTGWFTGTVHGGDAGNDTDFGGGTLTWQFKGPDGQWRTIFGGSDGTTAQAFTGQHSVNGFFADEVRVRGTLASATSPDLDWQIFSNPYNR